MRKVGASVAVVGLMWVVLGGGFARASTQCPSGSSVNYLAPVEALPQIRTVPLDGELGFGPAGLRLEPPWSSLLAGGGSVGFELGSSASTSTRSFRLGWRMRLDATRISAAGRSLDTVRTKVARLGSSRVLGSNPIAIRVRLPKSSALYRLDIAFMDSHARPLGKYSEYVRVLPYRVKAELALMPTNVKSGSALSFIIKNRSTLTLEYGRGVLIDEKTPDGKWIPYPLPMGWGGSVIGLPPGVTGPCRYITLPDDLLPGAYRLSKEVTVGKKDFTISAPFSVSG